MAGARTKLTWMRRAKPGLAASKGRVFARLSRALFACILAAFFAPLASWQPAFGQAQTSLEQIVQPPKVDPSEPMLLQADELIYDNDNARVTAKGNVELYYGNYTLLADRVIYDRSANTLSAEGNVRIKDPDGAVITSDQITLTDDFRDGFIDALKLVTKDDTRIVASSASRQAGNVTVFEKGWFTPCKPCLEKPDKPPTWRIRAGKITHKRDQATITFKNAMFDLWGVPVVWVPWFQMADPTVKRKSGFLMPSYSHSSDLGSTVQIPYYFALSDHYDFTFAPMVTEKAGTLLLGDWRHRLSSGAYRVELAGVWDEGTLDSPTDGDFRGSIKTEGRFALNPYWSYGWDILAETDETFRRFYNLDSRLKTDRISQLYLEGLHDRNYASMRFYNTQSLLFTDEPFSDATVFPIIDYDYIVNNPIVGGELSFNSNVMVFQNQDGIDSNRLIVEANWRRQMIDGIGQVFTPFAQLRGDIYGVSGLEEGLDGSEDFVDDEKEGSERHSARRRAWRRRISLSVHRQHRQHHPCGRADRPDHRAARCGGQSAGNPQRRCSEPRLRRHDPLRPRQVLRLRPHRNRHARQCRRALHRSIRLRRLRPRRLRPELSDRRRQRVRHRFLQTSGLATDTSDYVGGLYVQAASFIGFSAQSRFDEQRLRHSAYRPFVHGRTSVRRA